MLVEMSLAESLMNAIAHDKIWRVQFSRKHGSDPGDERRTFEDLNAVISRNIDAAKAVAREQARNEIRDELRAARERIAELEHRERAASREGFDAHVRQCEAFGLFKRTDLAEVEKEIDEFGRKADELYGAEVTGGRTEGEP